MTRRIGRWLLVGLILGLGLTPATSRAAALVTLQLLARPDTGANGNTAPFTSTITPTSTNEAFDYIVVATLAPAGTFNANLLANDPTSDGTIGSWDYPNPNSGSNDGFGATVYSLYEGASQTTQVSFQNAGFLGANAAGGNVGINARVANTLTSQTNNGNFGNTSFTGATQASTYTYPSNTGTQTPTGVSSPVSAGNAMWQNFAAGTGFSGGTLSSRGSGGNDLLHAVALAGSDVYLGIDDGDVDSSGTDQSPITVMLQSGSTSSRTSNSTSSTFVDNSFRVTGSIGAGTSTLNINAYNLITGSGALGANDKYLNISYTDNNGNQVHPGVGGSFSYSNQISGDPIINYVGLTIQGTVASGNTSVLTMNPNTGSFGNVLRNGTVTTAGTINNTPGNGTDVGTYSGASSAGMSGPATGSANPGNNTINVTLLASGTAANGPYSGTYTVTNTSVGNTDTGDNKVLTMSATVGTAGADTSNSSTVFGPALGSTQVAGSSFAGLASTVTASSSGPILGGPIEHTTATIVQGQDNSGGPDSVSMQWRGRTLSETAVSQGGSPSNPPLQPDLNPLISDVVNLSLGETNPTSVFALQMTYNTSLAEATVLQSKGLIYLGWLNPNGGGNGVAEWVNSVAGNTGAGGTVDTNVDSSYAAWASANSVTDANVGNFLGSWGVDLADGEVWAVLNHNSQFAVVPEPAAIVLAAFGVLGLLGARRRKKS